MRKEKENILARELKRESRKKETVNGERERAEEERRKENKSDTVSRKKSKKAKTKHRGKK